MKVLHHWKCIFNYQTNRKKIVAIIPNQEHEAFIKHKATFNIYFNIGNKLYCWKKASIVYLKANKAFIGVSSKDADFADIFL